MLFIRCFKLIFTARHHQQISYTVFCRMVYETKKSITGDTREQEKPKPRVHRPEENSASLVSHWNGGPSGWDFTVLTDHQWRILFISHTVQARGKDKNEQPHVGHTMIPDAKIMSPCNISAFSGSLFHVLSLQNEERNLVSKKKNPLLVSGWDRNIHPSRSPTVITRQVSWCQSLILGTDFSIPSSHSWRILIISSPAPNKGTKILHWFWSPSTGELLMAEQNNLGSFGTDEQLVFRPAVQEILFNS